MTTVQSETGVLAGEERMLIDGELQHTASGAMFDVIHPASEEVAGQATDGTVEDMGRAASWHYCDDAFMTLQNEPDSAGFGATAWVEGRQ